MTGSNKLPGASPVTAYLAALLIVAQLGCSSRAPAPSVSDPAAGGRKVQVVAFNTKGVNVSGYDQSVESFGRRIAESIATSLRKQGASAMVVPDDSTGKGAMLVEGTVVSVDGGSRAARWAIGAFSGAGAASVTVQGRVLAEDGRVLGEFRSSDSGRMGAFGGNTDEILDACVEVIGADVADMIVTGEYRRD